MKLEIKTEGIKEFVKKNRRLLIWVFLIVLLVIIFGGSYLALNPRADENAKYAGEKRLQELNIDFDKKTLDELQREVPPSVVNGSSGRNPFMSY